MMRPISDRSQIQIEEENKNDKMCKFRMSRCEEQSGRHSISRNRIIFYSHLHSSKKKEKEPQQQQLLSFSLFDM